MDELLNNRMDLSTLKNNASVPVVIYDDDHYYLASTLAEKVVAAGLDCVFITPSPVVASWSSYTLEQTRIQSRLLKLGVTVITNHQLAKVEDGLCHLKCVYTDSIIEQAMSALIPVTARVPNDALWRALEARSNDWQSAGITRIKNLGDSYAPGLIAAAVHAGHAFGTSVARDAPPVLREDAKL